MAVNQGTRLQVRRLIVLYSGVQAARFRALPNHQDPPPLPFALGPAVFPVLDPREAPGLIGIPHRCRPQYRQEGEMELECAHSGWQGMILLPGQVPK